MFITVNSITCYDSIFSATSLYQAVSSNTFCFRKEKHTIPEMNVFIKSTVSTVKPVQLVRSIVTSSVNHKNEPGDIIHPESHEPGIPPYIERSDENSTVKRARLTYQSRKRGMLENGLLLSTFAKKYLSNFDDQQLQLYDHLINLPSNDWDIFYWATGAKPTPPEFDNEIMDLLKKHIKNEDRQVRIMQPNL